jgi:hypothetical protein
VRPRHAPGRSHGRVENVVAKVQGIERLGHNNIRIVVYPAENEAEVQAYFAEEGESVPSHYKAVSSLEDVIAKVATAPWGNDIRTLLTHSPRALERLFKAQRTESLFGEAWDIMGRFQELAIPIQALFVLGADRVVLTGLLDKVLEEELQDLAKGFRYIYLQCLRDEARRVHLNDRHQFIDRHGRLSDLHMHLGG